MRLKQKPANGLSLRADAPKTEHKPAHHPVVQRGVEYANRVGLGVRPRAPEMRATLLIRSAHAVQLRFQCVAISARVCPIPEAETMILIRHVQQMRKSSAKVLLVCDCLAQLLPKSSVPKRAQNLSLIHI